MTATTFSGESALPMSAVVQETTKVMMELMEPMIIILMELGMTTVAPPAYRQTLIMEAIPTS